MVGLVDQLVKSFRKPQIGKGEPLLAFDVAQAGGEGTGTGISHMRKVCLVAIPGASDIIATALCSIGMLYIPASVWQMLRGSSIIFAAMFSMLALKKKMYTFNWVGLALCVSGVLLVGVASLCGDSSNSGGAEDMAV